MDVVLSEGAVISNVFYRIRLLGLAYQVFICVEKSLCQHVFFTLQSSDDRLESFESFLADSFVLVGQLGHPIRVLVYQWLEHLAFSVYVVLLHIGRNPALDFLGILTESHRWLCLLNLSNRRSYTEYDCSSWVTTKTCLEDFGQRRVPKGNVLSLAFSLHRYHLC